MGTDRHQQWGLLGLRPKQIGKKVDLPDGRKIRKELFDAIKAMAEDNGNTVPAAAGKSERVKQVAQNGVPCW